MSTPEIEREEWRLQVRDWWYSIQDQLAEKDICLHERKRVEMEQIVKNALTTHDAELWEKIEGMKKDGKQIRDKFFPNVEGEPTPNEDWADIINWKSAYNSGVSDVQALLTTKK